MQYEHFFIKILVYNVETWYIGNIGTLPGQFGSAQKLATLAGGYYPLYYGVIAPGDHWILIRCAAHHPTRSVPLNYCRGYFVAFVLRCNSAASCHNVVRPAENQLVKFWIHLPWRIMRPPMMHLTRSMAWIRPNRGMIPIPVNRLRTKAVGTHTAQTKQLSNRKVTMV